MVLQAASWQSSPPPVCNADAAGCTARCKPFPPCAPFPSEARVRDRVLAPGAPRPRLLLWYGSRAGHRATAAAGELPRTRGAWRWPRAFSSFTYPWGMPRYLCGRTAVSKRSKERESRPR